MCRLEWHTRHKHPAQLQVRESRLIYPPSPHRSAPDTAITTRVRTTVRIQPLGRRSYTTGLIPIRYYTPTSYLSLGIPARHPPSYPLGTAPHTTTSSHPGLPHTAHALTPTRPHQTPCLRPSRTPTYRNPVYRNLYGTAVHIPPTCVDTSCITTALRRIPPTQSYPPRLLSPRIRESRPHTHWVLQRTLRDSRARHYTGPFIPKPESGIAPTPCQAPLLRESRPPGTAKPDTTDHPSTTS